LCTYFYLIKFAIFSGFFLFHFVATGFPGDMQYQS